MTTGKILICFLFLYFSVASFPLYATGFLHVTDPRVIALGGNGVVLCSSLNPAVSAFFSDKDLQLSYLNRYALKELNTASLDFHYHNEYLPFGVGVTSFGFDDYRESMFRLSGGKQLGKRWYAGIAVAYYWTQGKLLPYDYSSLAVGAGLIYKPVESFRFGMSVMNMPAIRLSNNNEGDSPNPDYILLAGFSWELLSGCTLSGQLENHEESALSYGVGISYAFLDDVEFRLGLRTDPLLPSGGIGYRFRSFRTDVSASYHQHLGVSTGIGFTYLF